MEEVLESSLFLVFIFLNLDDLVALAYVSTRYARIVNKYYILQRQREEPSNQQLDSDVFIDTPNRKWIPFHDELPLTTKHDKFNFDVSCQDFTPQRKEVHKQIFSMLDQHVPSQKNPKAIVIIGGPGSGKEYVLNYLIQNNQLNLSNFVVVNLDSILVQIPEFRKAINLGISKSGKIRTAQNAAVMCHSESSFLHVSETYHVVENKYNFIYDGTGNNLKYYQLLTALLRANNYSIEIIFVKCPVHVAIKRIKKRADKEGRFVPDQVVKWSYHMLSINFSSFKQMFQKVSIYDNSMDGQQPLLVEDMDLFD